uniref:Odorant binding protein 4 n=1 Tax=Ips typographus TaxID=55986 RepID=M3TYY8_IPSTY
MISAVIFFALVGTIFCADADLTQQQKDKLLADGKACVAETGVSTDLIQAARQGKFTEDDKLKAFSFCMSKRLGFQNDAGDIQTEVVKQKLGGALGDLGVAAQLVTKCLVPKATPQETAFESFRCYYQNTPTHLTVF